MGIINIEGLGEIEIQGDTPTPEEEKAILEALGATTDTTDTIETEDVDTSKVSPGIGDVEKGLETESIIPQLMETEQAEGLDKIFLSRPVFEATGAVFGAIPGTAFGLPGTVAAGTAGASAGGQKFFCKSPWVTCSNKKTFFW